MPKLNVVIPDEFVEIIGKDGARTKYRKVERDAKAGDVIKITDSDVTSYVIEGAFYEVERLDFYDDPQIIGEDGYEFDAAGVGYEVYEKVAESAEALDPRNKFAKGDKVRIVSGAGERYLIGYKNGDIVEITAGADMDGDYILSAPREDVVPGTAKAEQLEKVSAEEIAEIEKWAAIGRKVNEYKPGDLVKCVGSAKYETGIGEVLAEVAPQTLYKVKYENPQYGVCTEGIELIELIVPVEQRFDREEAA